MCVTVSAESVCKPLPVSTEDCICTCQRSGRRRLDLTTDQLVTAGAVPLLTQTTAISISLQDNPMHFDGLDASSPSLLSITLQMVNTPEELIILATASAPGLQARNLEQVDVRFTADRSPSGTLAGPVGVYFAPWR